jgi:hypothetical protein
LQTFEELSFDTTTTVLEAVEQLAGIIRLQVWQVTNSTPTSDVCISLQV